MNLTLKKVVIERKLINETKELRDGLKIEYYNDGYTWEENPSKGVVKKIEDKFIIHWEDFETATEINETEKAKKILRYCGFV